MILVADHLFVVLFCNYSEKKNSIFVPEIGTKIYLLTFFVVAVYLFIFLLVYYLVFGGTKMSLSMRVYGYPLTSFSLHYFYIFFIF